MFTALLQGWEATCLRSLLVFQVRENHAESLSLDSSQAVSLMTGQARVPHRSSILQYDSAQFGNRKGGSTVHYLVDLIQYILDEAERGNLVNLLTINYSKAFDSIDIIAAIHHLHQMNVRPHVLQWVADFLSGREQPVRLSSLTSTWSAITCGVPQATRVGPVVFLAMVNPVAEEVQRRWKYIDDISLGESCNRRSPDLDALQNTMDGVCRRADLDHMTLNAQKCTIMQFFFGRPQPPAPEVTANGQRVPVVSSITLLGVTAGPGLKWHLHINKITSKANSVCYFLIVLRRSGMSQEHLIRFYTTFVRPNLEYAAPA